MLGKQCPRLGHPVGGETRCEAVPWPWILPPHQEKPSLSSRHAVTFPIVLKHEHHTTLANPAGGATPQGELQVLVSPAARGGVCSIPAPPRLQEGPLPWETRASYQRRSPCEAMFPGRKCYPVLRPCVMCPHRPTPRRAIPDGRRCSCRGLRI